MAGKNRQPWERKWQPHSFKGYPTRSVLFWFIFLLFLHFSKYLLVWVLGVQFWRLLNNCFSSAAFAIWKITFLFKQECLKFYKWNPFFFYLKQNGNWSTVSQKSRPCAVLQQWEWEAHFNHFHFKRAHISKHRERNVLTCECSGSCSEQKWIQLLESWAALQLIRIHSESIWLNLLKLVKFVELFG